MTELLEMMQRIGQKIEAMEARLSLGQKEWLSPDEAQDYSGISVRWLRDKIKSKELPASNYGSDTQPRWLIKRTELDAFILGLR